MYRFNAVLGGALGGVIGAAIWAGVAYFSGYEIGWIAWGVGILAGVGVAKGNSGEGSKAAGALAAIIAALAVVGGKYAMVELAMPNEGELFANTVAALEDDEYVVSYIADDVVAEFEAEGRAVEWPEGVEALQATTRAEYPADVWNIALSRWEGMDTDGQQAYRDEIRANIEASMAEIREFISQAGFMSSFGLLDIVFFGLAVVTAFKIGQAGTLKEGNA